MAQTVFRGDSLYESTTYGYTPFATIITGYWMKLTVPLGMNTITSSKILGIILYGLNVGSFYLLSKEVFTKKQSAWISTTLFAGLSFLAVWSGTGAESKHFVLLFTILGLIYLIKRKWFWVGLTFGLAAMCWHVAVINFLAVIPIISWKRTNELKKVITNIFIGVLIALIPVIAYLWMTEGWIYFWNQAILRKVLFEGSEVGESPLKWLLKAWFPSYSGDFLHFLAAALGFFLLASKVLTERISKQVSSINVDAIGPLFSITIVCAVFNSIEFQGPPDNITILPSIVLFACYFFVTITGRVKNMIVLYSLISLLLVYNFLDAIIYRPPYTYQEQLSTISELKEKYGPNPFTINFEEYYAITEQRLPTKYVRLAKYEDVLIDNIYGEKSRVYDAMKSSNYLIIKSNKPDLSKSFSSLKHLVLRAGYKSSTSKVYKEGLGEVYMNNLDLTPVDTFKIKVDQLLLDSKFYVTNDYVVFRNNSPE
ncbi:MAG: hypothetical protein RLN88_06490 [Ekhidna sp.]|uniref:hypothetical protein n=1 Tax=Ekhidna sp. TaxID=2608089 RepID=UPI0032F07948